MMQWARRKELEGLEMKRKIEGSPNDPLHISKHTYHIPISHLLLVTSYCTVSFYR